MAYYQNLFADFFQSWPLGDRQYSVDFKIGPNKNTDNYQLAWNNGPYDFTSSGVLTFNYAWDIDFKNYSSLAIDVTGVIPSATTKEEVVALLNANSIFAEMFTAQTKNNSVIILYKSGRVKPVIRLWISN